MLIPLFKMFLKVRFNEFKDTSVSLLVHIPHLFLACSIEMRTTGCQPVVYVLIKVSMENNMLYTVKGAFKDIPIIMWILQAFVTFAITVGTYKSFFGAYFCSIMIVVLLSIALKQFTSKYLFEGIANARQGKDY